MCYRALAGTFLAACLAGGCSSAGPEALGNDAWVGTIRTQGDVTTVVNESGSVWGGTARLVEEASIGVDAGADEYMFGGVTGVFVVDDHIYVADVQVPVVRAYDLDGSFIANIGGEGEGPGEYAYPAPLTADRSGRLFILDSRHRGINAYTSTGEPLDTWPLTISRLVLPGEEE